MTTLRVVVSPGRTLRYEGFSRYEGRETVVSRSVASGLEKPLLAAYHMTDSSLAKFERNRAPKYIISSNETSKYIEMEDILTKVGSQIINTSKMSK